VLNFFTLSSATILRNAGLRAIEYGESFDLKLQMHTAQDNTIWVRVAGQPEMGDGQAVRLYGSIQDITLRSQIEEQLREAQKLEAIGQLAGGIAHDFNNLLTTINGMSELALLYLDRMAATTGTDRVRNYLSEIHRAGGRAARLTRQLLAFSRKQVLHPKVLDLRADVMKTQALMQQILGENIELVLMMPSHLGLVMADPSQIEQVIINLVINARDAMPDGGTLSIRLMNAAIDEAAARRHIGLHPGNYVVLEVQDSGHGMTPEVQARLFDPFFTTKSVGAGSGLGLATVYGIVKQSGGLIEVDSQPPAGTTFRLFFPQSTPAPQESKTVAAFVRGGTETILLVGDDAWARQGYRVALEAKGYRLLDAASGREAITICQSYIGPIHLLVISVIHDMSKMALANQALLSRADLRVLILESARKSAPLDAPPPNYSFLSRPFTPETLATKVRASLDAPASTPML
jgi:signal transduction histidine kinase